MTEKELLEKAKVGEVELARGEKKNHKRMIINYDDILKVIEDLQE